FRLPDQSEFNPKADLPLIFSKNADVPGHPASVTKLMTAVTALDYVSGLEEQFMIQETDITPGMGDYFLPGDILTLKDLLYGMMLPSSNTCATAMARIAGEKIAARLN
ncbi:MAG: serine hydrolase, partial [Bacillales bacterium]